LPGSETPTTLSYQGNIVVPTQSEGAGSTTSAPAGGQTIASAAVVPGEYTVNWIAGLGASAAVGDQDNFGLYSGATLVATSSNPGAAGEYPQAAVVVLANANTTLAVKALAGGTSTQYNASISATPFPVVSPDDPLYPYNPLTANGATLTITTTPITITNVIAGIDLAAQAECQTARGIQIPAGSTDFGFVDTTYLPSQAQILNGPGAGLTWASPAGTGQFCY
jgi:hypothetical protein